MMLEYWRLQRGWSQAELAAAAGVTRQLVAAAEAGRNSPSVHAALGLANALGVGVEALFAGTSVSGLDGRPPERGTPVRLGSVGRQLIGVTDGVPDAIVAENGLDMLPDARPAATVIVGCDPALQLAGQLLARAGQPVLVAHGSSGLARAALLGGRAHAALVHGPVDTGAAPPSHIRRFGVARWQVGLAARIASIGVDELSARRLRVVQREVGAETQETLRRATSGLTRRLTGPIGTSHADVARLVAAGAGAAGITTLAAARANGLAFEALELHDAELWVPEAHLCLSGVVAFLDTLTSQGFRRRAATFAGYDLSGCGVERAAS